MSREIVLDTETTGLDHASGHRIIEIGCVEMVDRLLTGNNFHVYINPLRKVEPGAIEVHGITNEFLADKPTFNSIYEEFYQFIKGANLIIHNAAFDCGFIDHEFKLLDKAHISVWHFCTVIDTLKIARNLHPGQRNNLDALCKRYSIDNSKRDYHGALLDAEILAQVYLRMTGGQDSLFGEDTHGETNKTHNKREQLEGSKKNIDFMIPEQPLPVLQATDAEMVEHQAYLDFLRKNCPDEVKDW